jgi:hypothetical protein
MRAYEYGHTMAYIEGFRNMTEIISVSDILGIQKINRMTPGWILLEPAAHDHIRDAFQEYGSHINVLYPLVALLLSDYEIAPIGYEKGMIY